MKEVIYRHGIRQTPKLLALAEQATKALEDVGGKKASLVSAEWDRGKGPRGSDLLVVTLSFSRGSVMRVFEPEELQYPPKREIDLRLLWGDLLQIKPREDRP
jgi:hypothetical protein